MEKGYPENSWASDNSGKNYFSQYDVFTIGAGYLHIYSSLKSTDIVNGGAPSPIAFRNTSTGKYGLMNSQSITWGNSITWGRLYHLGQFDRMGGNCVISDSIIWGD